MKICFKKTKLRKQKQNPEKNLSEQRREPTTNSTHIRCRRWDLNPGKLVRGECSQQYTTLAPQSGFQLHSSFVEIFCRTKVVFIVVLRTVMVQKALFRNSPVC